MYFDSSAFVKLLHPEIDNDRARDLWSGARHPTSSRLAHAEVCAAVATAQRSHRLDANEAQDALSAWLERWRYVRSIDLTESVARAAGHAAAAHALKGADAIHLASALALGSPDVIFATWDRRLHTAARASGLRVAPAVLG